MNKSQLRQTKKAVDHLQRLCNSAINIKNFDLSKVSVSCFDPSGRDAETVERVAKDVQTYIESWVLPRLYAVVKYAEQLTPAQLKKEIIFRTFKIDGWHYWAKSESAILKFADGRPLKSTDGIELFPSQRFEEVAPGVYGIASNPLAEWDKY